MTKRKRAETATIEADGIRFRRIFVGVGQVVEFEKGVPTSYRGGEFYHVPEALAAELIEKDVAYDPDDVPACPACGVETAEFVREGDKTVGPRALIERHVIANHPEAVPDAAPAEPPASPAGEG